MKEKNNILIIVPNDNVGGAEGILKMIASHFKNELVEVMFLTKKNTNSWKSIGEIKFSFSSFGSPYLGALGLLFSLIFKPRKRKYDYIFTSHVFVTGLAGILIRLRLIKKVLFIGRESTLIFNRFSGIKLMLYKMMYKFGYPSVDLLICQTDHMKAELLNNLPSLTSKTKVIVIPNPIDMGEVPKSIYKPYNDKYIVSAGRLIKEKGFDILINVFYDFRKHYPGIKLVILGEGVEREFLESLIRVKKLDGEVLLMGFVTNVYDYFREAEICVVSSRVEGFPNVLLQMMSQNTRVVSTKCAGGIDEIEGIFIAEVNNEENLLNAMIASLAIDTLENRNVFDRFLESRSIISFINKIEVESQSSRRNNTDILN